MTTITTSFALNSLFDPNPAHTSLNKTKDAFDHRNHRETVHYATDSIIKIQQQQLILLLDISAHSYGIKAKFDKAIKHSEEIIEYVPNSPAGYIRLGGILEMQGYHEKAAKVYEKALEKILQDDPAYPQLVQLKKTAIEKNEHIIDFVATLPSELAGSIFESLPELDKAACFNVSSTWRRKMVGNGATVWKTIHNEYSVYDKTFGPIISGALPYIAEEVQRLTISDTQRHVWLRYLEYMETGRFKKIKSLAITDNIAYNFMRPNMLMSFTSALWNLKNTLTSLDITIRRLSAEEDFTIVGMLFYCPNLRRLVVHSYTITDHILGDMEILGEPRHALVDVNFTGILVTGSNIIPFLKRYPNIQRLILKSGHGVDTLDVINENCPNLKLFGNEPHQVSTLEDLAYQKYDYDGPTSGLREIITQNNCAGVPAEKFLRLLRNNAKSLQRVNANMSMTSQQMEDQGDPNHYFVRPIYPGWKFERLEYLHYHPDIFKATEPLFLQSIRSCKTLKTFEVENTSDVQSIVDTLTSIPPVETLGITNTTNAPNSALALTQLFKTYAQILPTSKRKFHTISIEYCNFITKQVLDALAKLETIKVLKFSGTCSFQSYDDLKCFLQKISHRLVEVSLLDISFVDGTILRIIGSMQKLKTLTLGNMQVITNESVIELVDSLKPASLCSITIKDSKLSKDTIDYIKRKIAHAEFL